MAGLRRLRPALPCAREIVDVWVPGAVASAAPRVPEGRIEVCFGPLNYYPLNPLESCSKAQLADRPLKSNGKLPSHPINIPPLAPALILLPRPLSHFHTCLPAPPYGGTNGVFRHRSVTPHRFTGSSDRQ